MINVSCKKLKRFKNDLKWVENDLSGERLIFMNVAYNMDCLPAMMETPDNFYDLAVCDPPYGDGMGGNPDRFNGNRFKKYNLAVENRGG